MTIVLKTLSGGTAEVPDAKLIGLRNALRGSLIGAEDPGYDEARAVWNGMIDRCPGLIARALDTNDIRLVVNFARQNGLLLAVKSGGHQIAGHAVADGTLLLDLSQMRGVKVDGEAATATVEPGCLLSDVDQETQRYGLAVPLGINSTTGVAGLTLGGGFGWITGKHGLTIDNLLSAEVVCADGNIPCKILFLIAPNNQTGGDRTNVQQHDYTLFIHTLTMGKGIGDGDGIHIYDSRFESTFF